MLGPSALLGIHAVFPVPTAWSAHSAAQEANLGAIRAEIAGFNQVLPSAPPAPVTSAADWPFSALGVSDASFQMECKQSLMPLPALRLFLEASKPPCRLEREPCAFWRNWSVAQWLEQRFGRL